MWYDASVLGRNDMQLGDSFALDLYAAVLDGRSIASAVRPLARQLQASTHAVHLMRYAHGTPRDSRSEGGKGMSPEIMAEYGRFWIRHDPWAHAAAQAPDGVLNFSRVVAPDLFVKTPIWNEWAAPRDGAFSCMAGLVHAPGGIVGGIAFHRSVRAEPFSRRDEELLRPLFGHLRRALLAEARLAQAGWEQSRAMRAGFSAMRQGVALLDEERRVVVTNPALEMMAAEEDGLSLVPDGGISSHDPVARQALARAIGSAMATLGGKVKLMPDAAGLVLPRRSGGAPWLVQVMPLRRLEAHGLPEGFTGVMVLVTDDEQRPRPRAPLLRQAFGLTAAEGALAAALAAGKTVAEHAASRRIAVGTAHGQVAAIRRKTGCRTQVELAALLARLTG